MSATPTLDGSAGDDGGSRLRVLSGGRRGTGHRAGIAFSLTTYLAVLAGVFVVAQLSWRYLPSTVQPHRWPDHPWLGTFARWDTGWYWHIANDGYYYDGPGRQSAVAFFPAYPLAMRAVGFVVRDLIVAGVLISCAAGASYVWLFYRWCRSALGERAARASVLLLVLYPFAYFLFGAVYSDALFAAAALAAFVLVEQRRLLLATVAGAVAAAARPVGVAVVIGLLLRAFELRGVLPGSLGALVWSRRGHAGRRIDLLPRRLDLSRFRWRDCTVALSALGFAAFCGLLWWRFGEPLAFTKVERADGWNRHLGPDALLMVDYFRRLADHGWTLVNVVLTLQGLLSIGAVALIPAVVRRFGWAYGAYTLILVGAPLLTSSDFLAMGRYLLPAFPCFAVAGAALADRPWPARVAVLAASAAGLGLMTSFFARWYLLS
ncbi:MAG: hypothetical protein KY454_00580 [Actinobacteria bacterium]|nr:hypothetical protein [Actinomycetota bacterium]MBW3649503.1 hypothetical protein [Actinomycetota bacterium]